MAESMIEEQAPPKPNTSRPIWELVVEEMQERDRVGRERYGTPLQAGNGRDALVDAYQEALDQTVFLRKEIAERRTNATEVGERWIDDRGVAFIVDGFECGGPHRQARLVEEGVLHDPMIATFVLYENDPTLSMAARGWTYRPHPVPHRAALVAEVARLQAREQGLLEVCTRLVETQRKLDRQAMVRHFMRGIAEVSPKAESGFIGLRPVVPSDRVVRLRAKLIVEECLELVDALFDLSTGEAVPALRAQMGLAWSDFLKLAPVRVDMVAFADATVDLDYVTEGARVAFGIDAAPLWEAVQAANMRKLGPGVVVREDGKFLKPADWEPPPIEALLRAQGWSGVKA